MHARVSLFILLKNEYYESILYHSTTQSMTRLYYTFFILFVSTYCIFYRYTDPITVSSSVDDDMKYTIDTVQERILFCRFITGSICGIDMKDTELKTEEKKEDTIEDKKEKQSIKKYKCSITSDFWSSIIKCMEHMEKIKDYKKQAYYAVEVIVYDRKILKDSTIVLQKGNVLGIVTTLYKHPMNSYRLLRKEALRLLLLEHPDRNQKGNPYKVQALTTALDIIKTYCNSVHAKREYPYQLFKEKSGKSLVHVVYPSTPYYNKVK